MTWADYDREQARVAPRHPSYFRRFGHLLVICLCGHRIERHDPAGFCYFCDSCGKFMRQDQGGGRK